MMTLFFGIHWSGKISRNDDFVFGIKILLWYDI